MDKPKRRDATPDPAQGAGALDLTESREWLRVTLSSIGDAVITTDASGRCTFLNPVAEQLTGWTNREASGAASPGNGVSLEHVFRIVNEDSRATVENPATRALREGVVVGLANHTLLIARDGTERPIDDSGAPIRNAKGQIAGVVLVFRDITERRQQERTIAESLTYAQAIISTVRAPFVVLTGVDLQVQSANKSFYRTFEVSEEDTIGTPLYELGNGQWNIPRLRELLGHLPPSGGELEDFEVDHDFPRIGRRILRLNARRLRDGVPEGLILLSMVDETQRVEAERRVRQSEVRYRRLFQSAKDGILIVNADDGKILDCNSFMSGMLGLDTQQVIGRELWEIGVFKDRDENKRAFRQLQRDGYIRYDHLPLQNQRGEALDVEFVSNVYEEDGHLVAQCNVRNIVERRLREQAQAAADENRRKDEFLAMLSHELRNPLAPIRTAAHLLRLQERPGSENHIQAQACDVIERQVANLSRLVNDILEVSRVMNGRIRVQLQRLDMREVVEHALESVQIAIDQRGHHTALSLPAEPVWVHADPTRMEEVIVNLLNNAAKYTKDDGKGRITIRLEIEAGEGARTAVLRIIDNGDGIDPELMPRLFDLFAQGKRSIDRSEGGLGIGLTLAQRLTELQGGALKARSDGPDRGSEFVVSMPLASSHAQEPGPGNAGGGAKQLTGEGVRVLVVDDNIDQVSMISLVLRQKGYSVQTAHTGPEGLRVAEEWRPEVVLLDIGLPELDGYEVARRLRADPRSALRNVRIIAITGYGRPEDVQLTKEAGFDDHMVKPIDFRELHKRIAAASR